MAVGRLYVALWLLFAEPPDDIDFTFFTGIFLALSEICRKQKSNPSITLNGQNGNCTKFVL